MADGSNYDDDQPTERQFKPNPYYREAMALRNIQQTAKSAVEKMKAAHAFGEPVELTPDETLLVLYSLHR